MKDNLEGGNPAVEEAPPTTGKEGVGLTALVKEPTVSETEAEKFRREVDKAVGKSLESINRQLSLSKAEANKAKAEADEHKANLGAIEAELKDLQRQHDDLVSQQFENDPEARQAFIDKRAIAEERRKLLKEKAEVERRQYEAEKLAWSAGMARKADALVKETGIDVSELEGCQTEEEMEVKALRYKLTRGAEEAPEFESGVSSGGGERTFTRAEIADRAFWEANRPKIMEAFRKGLIK